MATVEGYVGLTKLKCFCEFIQDEPGILAERIFESNVRGYQADTTVNRKIQETLKDANANVNFWLLNNGVTIISPLAAPAGHLRLSIDDPQIVNGLQTSREIFSYFTGKDYVGPENDERTLLVRVIQTADPVIQDMVIRATNSQNRMLPASLRMTDQIHRNIEEMFKKVDLFYDRRKGFWRDQAKPIGKIISVNAVVQAVVSILLQRPDDARGRPGDYFKDDNSYKSVFDNDKITIDAYLSCVQITRRVEKFFDDRNIDGGEERNLKFYVAAFLAREITGMTMPVAAKLPAYDRIASVDDSLIEACHARTKKIYDALSAQSDGDTVARGSEFLKRLNAQWKRKNPSARKKQGKLA